MTYIRNIGFNDLPLELVFLGTHVEIEGILPHKLEVVDLSFELPTGEDLDRIITDLHMLTYLVRQVGLDEAEMVRRSCDRAGIHGSCPCGTDQFCIHVGYEKFGFRMIAWISGDSECLCGEDVFIVESEGGLNFFGEISDIVEKACTPEDDGIISAFRQLKEVLIPSVARRFESEVPRVNCTYTVLMDGD